MQFTLGTQNETLEVHIDQLETGTKVVAKLLIVKLFHVTNTIQCFRNLSITHNSNKTLAVIHLTAYISSHFEEVTKIVKISNT